jgi:CPA1 family monovalent cation:H+ antiporter
MKPILSLAIGLVLVTILGIGLFIHWLIPAITVAAGFRPRGYSVTHRSGGGIGNDRQLAASLKDGAYLEGESLLNDASGLVAFNFAIAAVLTGSFSPGDAVVKFFLMAAGGSSVASWWYG